MCRFSYPLGIDARVSRTNFAAARLSGRANAPLAGDTRTSTAFRQKYDNSAPDKRGNALDEAARVAPRLELLGLDRYGEEAADKSSDVGVVAKANSRMK